MRRGVDRLAAIVRARGVEQEGVCEFHLLPDNVPVFRLWGQLQTQWMHGMAGPTGLNWQSLRQHPDVTRIAQGRRERLLQGVAEMECAWLAERGRIAAEKRNESC